MRVIWAPPAIDDVERIYDYIALFNPAAAARMVVRLRDAGDSLAELAERGRSGSVFGTRELVAVRPYVLVYEISERDVQVLRVWRLAPTYECSGRCNIHFPVEGKSDARTAVLLLTGGEEQNSGGFKSLAHDLNGRAVAGLARFDARDGVAMDARPVRQIPHGPSQRGARHAELFACHFNVHVSQ